MSAWRKIVTVTGWTLAGLVLAAAAYLLLLRPWHRTWGASESEAARPMPADGLVVDPDFEATRAVTIEAPPADVWPWLVQMGSGRGGFYGFDIIARARGIQDGPSATRILPGFQSLKPGDTVPFGNGPGWPVTVVEPRTSLVFDIRRADLRLTWSWLLMPLPDGKSRLLLRLRGRGVFASSGRAAGFLLDPGEYVAVRRMLAGIKARAEGRPRTPAGEAVEIGGWLAAILAGLIAWAAAYFRRAWRRPFTVAGAAFLLVFFLAFRQPAAAAVVPLVGLLWAGLVFSLRGPKSRT
ncbi:MAG: SRPBCC family protein [Acidobacteriota bacterium]|nr:SRPBCC family protein [Acidobacteriota bacterium]